MFGGARGALGARAIEPRAAGAQAAFDCLYVNGHDLRPLPLRERRATLEEEIRDQRLVLPVRRLAADDLEAWAESSAAGTKAWSPRKKRGQPAFRQEGRFVIGGVAMARAGDQGGILVGEWEDKRHLTAALWTWASVGVLWTPYVPTPSRSRARRHRFADLIRRRSTVWLEPVLQAEVSYGRIVGGQLREPVLRRSVTERPHASRRPPARPEPHCRALRFKADAESRSR